MEPVLYTVIALLLAVGPVVGFFFGAKCASHLLGIDLHQSDMMRTISWDDLPEIYRPYPADDDEELQDQPEDGGDARLAGKVHPEDAVDALLTALEAAREPLAQIMQDEAPLEEEPDAEPLPAPVAETLNAMQKALEPMAEQIRAANDAFATAFGAAVEAIVEGTAPPAADAERAAQAEQAADLTAEAVFEKVADDIAAASSVQATPGMEA